MIEQLIAVAQAGGPGIAVVFCVLFLMERKERRESQAAFIQTLSSFGNALAQIKERLK